MADGHLLSRDGTRGPWSDRIDALFADRDKAGHAGLNLAVVHRGEVVHARGYGVAEVEHDVPFTADTVLRLGSTSKHLCAACIYVLATEGRLSVDDDIRAFIPELGRLTTGITIDHLLTMSSGLPDWLNLQLFAGLPDVHPSTRAGMLAWLSRLETTMFAPGATSSYSNTNYALLSLIVERVSGMPLRAFMAERLFRPLGMSRTSLVPHGSETIAGMARGYQAGEAGAPVAGYMLPEIHGEGGVNSTLADMTRWLLSYRAGGAVPGLRAWLEDGPALPGGGRSPYRRAIVVDSREGITRVGHAGGMPGYLCEFAYYPELDIGIVMLTNWLDPALFATIDPIAEIVSGRIFAPTPAITKLPPAGLYVGSDETRVTALNVDDAGALCHCLGETILLGGENGGRWRFSKRGDIRSLSVASDGTLSFHDGSLPTLALTRCAEPLPVDDPSRYAGIYRCASLGEQHRIAWDGAQLVVSTGSALRSLVWGRLARRAASLFTAPIEGEPSETNVVLRFRDNADGSVAGFDYTIARISGLFFEKVSDATLPR